jgi:hypothetical protein
MKYFVLIGAFVALSASSAQAVIPVKFPCQKEARSAAAQAVEDNVVGQTCTGMQVLRSPANPLSGPGNYVYRVFVQCTFDQPVPGATPASDTLDMTMRFDGVSTCIEL